MLSSTPVFMLSCNMSHCSYFILPLLSSAQHATAYKHARRQENQGLIHLPGEKKSNEPLIWVYISTPCREGPFKRQENGDKSKRLQSRDDIKLRSSDSCMRVLQRPGGVDYISSAAESLHVGLSLAASDRTRSPRAADVTALVQLEERHGGRPPICRFQWGLSVSNLSQPVCCPVQCNKCRQ